MNEKTVRREELIKILEERFDKGESQVLVVTGHSMRPLLRHQRDKVIITSPQIQNPDVHDIVLFRRMNGKIVLHRILDITAQGDYIISGDAQTDQERVRKNQILAVVTAIIRKNRYISNEKKIYRWYVKVWTTCGILRRCFIAVDSMVFRLVESYRRKRKYDL